MRLSCCVCLQGAVVGSMCRGSELAMRVVVVVFVGSALHVFEVS
jgi:hypothetical protein